MGVMVERLAPRSEAISTIGCDFATWMTSEQRRIFLLCFRLLQDRDEADAATQDAFFKAYQALTKGAASSVEDPAKWLTRIAVNTCLDRIRGRAWKFWRRRREPAAEELVLATTPDREPSAEDRVFALEINRRLAAAMEKLSPRQRAVFALRHHEHRGVEEIGEILGLDTGTVKAHMSRALAKLREELRDMYGLI